MARPKQKRGAAVEMPKPGQLVRVKIVGPAKDGYRRGGLAHSHQAADHAAEVFTAEQIAQLVRDPNLEVSFVDAPKGAGS